MKTKKTSSEKRPDEATFSFPCGDFEKMAEMMRNCCPDEGSTFDCCSMMRKMMERSKGGKPGKTEEGQGASGNDKNG